MWATRDRPPPADIRSLQDLLLLLPRLPVTADAADFAAADPALLVQLAERAETVMGTALNGIAAIGHLLAHAAPGIEGREIPAHAAESLGFLVISLSELSAVTYSLAVACRRHTADYLPETVRTVPPVRI